MFRVWITIRFQNDTHSRLLTRITFVTYAAVSRPTVKNEILQRIALAGLILGALREADRPGWEMSLNNRDLTNLKNKTV